MAARSTFARMCDELARAARPRLLEAGYAPPREPFSRHTTKYPFTRTGTAGDQVLEILFDRRRRPLFAVQMFVVPPGGLARLEQSGGTLRIGSLSSSPPRWPLGVRPFRARPTRLERLLGRGEDRVEEAVASFLARLPEVEAWWRDPRPTRHILVGDLRYPGAGAGPGTASRRPPSGA